MRAVDFVVGERVEVEDRRRLTRGNDDGRGRLDFSRVADGNRHGRVLIDGAAARDGRADLRRAFVDARLRDGKEELAGEGRLRGEAGVVVLVRFWDRVVGVGDDEESERADARRRGDRNGRATILRAAVGGERAGATQRSKRDRVVGRAVEGHVDRLVPRAGGRELAEVRRGPRDRDGVAGRDARRTGYAADRKVGESRVIDRNLAGDRDVVRFADLQDGAVCVGLHDEVIVAGPPAFFVERQRDGRAARYAPADRDRGSQRRAGSRVDRREMQTTAGAVGLLHEVDPVAP